MACIWMSRIAARIRMTFLFHEERELSILFISIVYYRGETLHFQINILNHHINDQY